MQLCILVCENNGSNLEIYLGGAKPTKVYVRSTSDPKSGWSQSTSLCLRTKHIFFTHIAKVCKERKIGSRCSGGYMSSCLPTCNHSDNSGNNGTAQRLKCQKTALYSSDILTSEKEGCVQIALVCSLFIAEAPSLSGSASTQRGRLPSRIIFWPATPLHPQFYLWPALPLSLAAAVSSRRARCSWQGPCFPTCSGEV